MDRPPIEIATFQSLDRIELNQPQGWLLCARLPYKVYYNLECPTSDLIDERDPAVYLVTPNLGGGKSLSVMVHESVPVGFKHVVVFHELREAELVYADNIPTRQAHLLVAGETDQYAQRHLSREEFERFKEWQTGLNLNSDV